MAKRTMGRAYFEDAWTRAGMAELDSLATEQLAMELDLELDDPFLTPWKRGYGTAIRKALGH
jgi:hypothetical protein